MFGYAPPLALYSDDPATTSVSALGATTATLCGIYVPTPFPLASLRVWFSVSGNGNYDVGVYDANGNLLDHAGPVITAGNAQTRALSKGVLNLAPGGYYLALWVASNTDTALVRNGKNNMMVCQAGTVATQLPALSSSISGLANANTRPIIIGLRTGGWS